MYGAPVTVFTKTMASGGTLTSAIDLGNAYDGYSLELPSMASGGDVYIQGAATETGTYRRVYYKTPDSSPVALQIASAASNGIFNLDAYLPRYVKIEVSTAATATAYEFKIYGHG